jgi:hypothetical protein
VLDNARQLEKIRDCSVVDWLTTVSREYKVLAITATSSKLNASCDAAGLTALCTRSNKVDASNSLVKGVGDSSRRHIGLQLSVDGGIGRSLVRGTH